MYICIASSLSRYASRAALSARHSAIRSSILPAIRSSDSGLSAKTPHQVKIARLTAENLMRSCALMVSTTARRASIVPLSADSHIACRRPSCKRAATKSWQISLCASALLLIITPRIISRLIFVPSSMITCFKAAKTLLSPASRCAANRLLIGRLNPSL